MSLFFQGDFQSFLQDILAIVVVGRVQQGADCIGFLLGMLVSSGLLSIASLGKATNISLTFDSLKDWSALNWVAVICIAGLIGFLYLINFYYAYKQQRLIPYVVKNVFAWALLWAPHIGDSTFHVHHWFYGFFFALLTDMNEEYLLVRFMQAMAISVYLMGISGYGRDPVAGRFASGLITPGYSPPIQA